MRFPVLCYWWRVAKRSYADTKVTLGTNLTKSAIGYLVTIAAAFAWARSKGVDEAIDKAMWATILVVAGVVVFAAVFVACFMCTPAILEREATANAQVALDHKNKEIDRATQENASLRHERDEKRATYVDVRDRENRELRAELEERNLVIGELTVANRILKTSRAS